MCGGVNVKRMLALTILGVLLLSVSVLASPEVVFQWEKNGLEPESEGYIVFYQNFKQPYNFTVISDLVEKCWVIKDYKDEDRVVCRSENGLCSSLEPLTYQFIKCKTRVLKEEDDGERVVLFYEYGNHTRHQGVYQTEPLRIITLSKKIVAFGPVMIALVALIVFIVIILGIIYFAGNSIVSWINSMKYSKPDSFEELKEIKEQIGKKGEVFTNCIVIY